MLGYDPNEKASEILRARIRKRYLEFLREQRAALHREELETLQGVEVEQKGKVEQC